MSELKGYDDWKTTDPRDYDHCPECLCPYVDCECPDNTGQMIVDKDEPDEFVPEFFDAN